MKCPKKSRNCFFFIIKKLSARNYFCFDVHCKNAIGCLDLHVPVHADGWYGAPSTLLSDVPALHVSRREDGHVACKHGATCAQWNLSPRPRVVSVFLSLSPARRDRGFGCSPLASWALPLPMPIRTCAAEAPTALAPVDLRVGPGASSVTTNSSRHGSVWPVALGIG